MSRRATEIGLVAVGAVIVTISAVGLLARSQGPSPRSYGAASQPPTSAVSASHRAGQSESAASQSAASQSAASQSATSGSATPGPARRTTPGASSGQAPPVRLALPAHHVTATVVPVGTDRATLEVPPDAAEVGWWVASSPAGSAYGSTVIVGHVDSASSGPAPLFAAGRGVVKAGDAITLTTAAGDTFRYLVYAQEVVSKQDGLPASAFAFSSQPRLVVITCGGPFDRATGSYLDNVVLYAAPASR